MCRGWRHESYSLFAPHSNTQPVGRSLSSTTSCRLRELLRGGKYDRKPRIPSLAEAAHDQSESWRTQSHWWTRVCNRLDPRHGWTISQGEDPLLLCDVQVQIFRPDFPQGCKEGCVRCFTEQRSLAGVGHLIETWRYPKG